MAPVGPADTEPADSTTTSLAEPVGQGIGEPSEATSRWWWPTLLLFTVAGFAGRFFYLVHSRIDGGDLFRQGDAVWYANVTNRLTEGHFFVNFFTGRPTADHPPLTVLILAPVSKLFDGHTFPMRVTMVVIGSLTILLAGVVGRRLAGPAAGLAAAFLVAVHPALWVNDILIMSETPTAFLVVLVIGAGVELSRRPSPRRFLLVGALIGVATLCRAELALFIPLMVWPIAWVQRDRPLSRRMVLGGAALATAMVVVAPWSIYNTARFQVPVAISANDGVTLLGANCPVTYHGPVAGAWTLDGCIVDVLHNLDDLKPPLTAEQRVELADHPVGPECEFDQRRPPCWDSAKISSIMRTRALRYIRGHLSDLPEVTLKRHGRTWGLYQFDQVALSGRSEGRVPWVSRWGFYATWLLALPAVLGALELRRRRISLLPFGAALAVVLVTTTLFYGLTRFRITYDVASCLLAGVLVDQIWRAWLTRRQGRSGPGTRPPAEAG